GGSESDQGGGNFQPCGRCGRRQDRDGDVLAGGIAGQLRPQPTLTALGEFVELDEDFPAAVGTDAVAERGGGTLADVGLDFVPVILIVAHFLAVTANRQQ